MTPTNARIPGAYSHPGSTTTAFAVWATRAERVSVRFFANARDPERANAVPLKATGEGWFEADVPGAGPGSLYKFEVDGRELPDPCARFLPFGVHGPAEVIPRARPMQAFHRDAGGKRDLIYELHIGAFTAAGTYAAASERLPHLVDLRVTAIELMPLAAFPGTRGWGYDGVALFAPFAPYGRPEDLRAFVAHAHSLGLRVLLDVVYNHFGPQGNYLSAYAPEYFTDAHANPWGSAPDFTCPAMRALVLGNAHMWFDEYGFDGLRLDATHAIHDASPRSIVREIVDLAATYAPVRTIIAEDERNDPSMVTHLGVDAVWADDFHHQMRTLLTGERDGYYAAYEPTVAALAKTIEGGWIYEGQTYPPWNAPRGRNADALAASNFVYCVENHDQVGNRALGTRLDRDASADALRAATLVLLFLPMTPMLFMGQEWASSSPFLYFTDHDAEYGPLVSKGRRAEFGKFAAFADEAAQAAIPDPQASDTFDRSKLRWDERDAEPHRSVLAVVRAMTRLVDEDTVLRDEGMQRTSRSGLRAYARGDTLWIERHSAAGSRILVANLSPHVAACDVAALGSALFQSGAVADGSLGPFAVVIAEPGATIDRG